MPYRVDFTHADQAALLRLLDLGVCDVDLGGDGRGAAIVPERVAPADVARVLGTSEIAVSEATGRDADSVWILGPRAARLGRVRVVPASTASASREPGDIRLIDTPAFGTGLHATTALCVEMIDDLLRVSRVEAMLDVGTGSGVLALAALVLGVPHAVAIDVDADAARAARDNARENGLAGRLHAVHGGLDPIAGRWPLVVANVLAAPLIDMAPALAGRVGHQGWLILSGIQAGLQPDVERAYRRVGMHLMEVRVRAGWVAILVPRVLVRRPDVWFAAGPWARIVGPPYASSSRATLP